MPTPYLIFFLRNLWLLSLHFASQNRGNESVNFYEHHQCDKGCSTGPPPYWWRVNFEMTQHSSLKNDANRQNWNKKNYSKRSQRTWSNLCRWQCWPARGLASVSSRQENLVLFSAFFLRVHKKMEEVDRKIIVSRVWTWQLRSWHRGMMDGSLLITIQCIITLACLLGIGFSKIYM